MEMGGCGGRLMGLAFLLCMLSRVSCNSKASNGVLGQHQKAFFEKYQEEIQTYIMTGGEIGWQHCDLLTANDYQDEATPKITMEFDQIKTLNTKYMFSTSHCLLVIYHVNSDEDLLNLIEFGRKTFLHVRLALHSGFLRGLMKTFVLEPDRGLDIHEQNVWHT